MSAPAPGMRARWAPAALALALATLPLLLSLPNPIGGVDPSEYAEIGRELYAGHRWLPLRNDGEVYLDKPPLTFWTLRVAYSLFGPTPEATRVPALLGLALCAAGLAWLGRRLYGDATGLWAAALLLASPLVQFGVADPKIDLVLLGPLTLTVCLMVASRERPFLIAPAWAAAALGLLTKGPVAIALPAAAVLPEALRDPARGRSVPRRLLRFRPALGVAFALGCAWPFYRSVAADSGISGVRFLLWDQSFGRLLGHGARNATTPLFFLHTLLWAALPFTPALLVELAAALRRLRAEGWHLPPRPARIPLWWFAAGLLGISLSSYKLPQYLLWALPGAALLAARTLLHGPLPRWLAGIHLAVALLSAAGVAIFCARAFPSGAVPLAAGLTAAAALGWLWLRDREGARARWVPLGGAVVSGLLLTGWLHPALLAYDPGRALGTAVKGTTLPPGDILCVDSPPHRSVAFYAGRLTRPAALDEAVRAAATGPVAIMAPPATAEAMRARGARVAALAQVDTFRVAVPTARFLDPETRGRVAGRLGMWMAGPAVERRGPLTEATGR